MRLAWLLLLFVTVQSAPQKRAYGAGQSEGNCAKVCSGASSELSYEVGKSYVFDLSSMSSLKISDAGHKTAVTQRLKAHISVHSACEFSLKLTDVSLVGMNAANDWKQVLERHSIRFGFDDGKVVSVCPSAEDPIWAVNLKRSVLSTFQSVDDEDWETDILGECPVEREKRKSGSNLFVKTTKNVASCRRKGDISGIRSVPYRLNSKVQTTPIFESKQVCEREIRDGILQKAKCTENHKAASAFGKEDAIAATIEQTMVRVGEPAVAAQQPTFAIQKCIQYDHSEDEHVSKSSPNAARMNLDTLCHPGRAEAEAAAVFADLIFNLRGLTSSEIASIARKDCRAYLDALAACGTADCISQIGTLVNSRAAPDDIYSSLALLPDAKIGAVEAVVSFIDRAPLKGLLGISSLVQSYCISHPNCASEAPVKQVIEKLTARIERGCNVGEKLAHVQSAVLVLKAIGNIGNEEQSLTLLNECITNKRNKMEVRLAAIDALRRKSCVQMRSSKISEIFFDKKADEELRIASFRQLMGCPNEEIIQRVAESVDNETVNQVGSYVWSFLNSKLRSSNPSNHELKRLLKRKHVNERFNMDPRRFSRFYEVGYFDEQNNFGAHLDSSVVFTRKNYIPREVRFNLTIHLFGKSFNVMEIGARAEGLEPLEENLFGPDGYFVSQNSFEFRERKFRSKNDKVNQLKVLFLRNSDFVEDRLSASFFTRMFGDDLSYCGFEKDNIRDEIRESMDLTKYMDKLAKEKSVKINKNMLLASLTQTLPTLSGLPLQFALNASMVANVEHRGKTDLTPLLKQKGDLHMRIESRPSVSLVIGASLTIRAGQVASGAQIKSTLHSGTSVGLDIELKRGKMFSTKVLLPDDDATLVLIQTDVSKIDSNRYSRMRRAAPQNKRRCTGNTFGKLMGIKMCFEAWNQAESKKVAITGEKVDRNLQYYQLLVERESDKEHEKLKMSMDTPGSQVDRKIETNFDVSYAQKKIKMDAITPFKKISLNGDLEEKKKFEDYDAKMKLIIDGKEQYRLDGNFKVKKEQDRKKYSLNGNAVKAGKSAADISAEVEYAIKKPYAKIDFTLGKVFEKPIVLKTLLSAIAPQYETRLEYSGPTMSGKLVGSLSHTAFLTGKGSVKGEYQVGNQQKRTINVAIDQAFTKSSNDHLLKHSATLEVGTLPKLEYQLLSDRKGDVMKNLLEVSRSGKKSHINIDINRNPNNLYTAVATAKCDTLGLDHKMEISYQNKFPQQFLFKMSADTPKMKGLVAHIEHAMKVDPKWNCNGKVRLAYPGRELLATNVIDESDRGKYKVDSHVQWDRDKKIDVTSDVVFRPKEREYTVESTARVAGVPEPIHVKKHVRYQNDNYNVHWQARQGSTVVYEFIGDSEGRFGSRQKFNMEVKSEKFSPKFSYQMVGNVEPSADSITVHAVAKKDGKEQAKGVFTLPKSLKAPVLKYDADVSWTYENRLHRMSANYLRTKDASGSTHKLNADADSDAKLMLQFDKRNNGVLLKCITEKSGKRVFDAQIKTGPMRLVDFEIEGSMETDSPLPKRSSKGKAKFTYKQDQAFVEGKVESNGERYLAEGKWKKMKAGEVRHYIYSGKLDSPHGGLEVSQQLQVEKAFTVRKAETDIEMKAGHDSYKLLSEMESGPEMFKLENQFKGKGTAVKHNIDYTHKGGKRTLKKFFKYNDKEIESDIETVYQDNEVKIDIETKSSLPYWKSISGELGCKKAGDFWRCEVQGNVNDKYVIKGHEDVSSRKGEVGYLLKLDSLVNNEGKLEYALDKPSEKYYAKGSMRNNDKKYNFEMDLQRDRGTFKLQTPAEIISNAQLKITKKGPEEYDVMSEGGKGKVHMQLRTAGKDQLFKIQVTQIAKPFEVTLKNAAAGGKQTSLAEFISDPLGKKKIYGVENVIESEGDKFRALRTTLKHPKRSVQIDVLRPAHNKYSLRVQPNVGSSRRPTVAEMTYDKTSSGYNWQGSLSDDALQSPLRAKFEWIKSGNDEHNYGMKMKSEFDYSGSPDKLISKSLIIERHSTPSGDVKFDAEFKCTHPASNLHTRIWANIYRQPIDGVLTPVRMSIGAELKNAKQNLVEYSVNAETDAKKYTEFKLTAPQSFMKARIDMISDKHLRMAFFKDSEKASMVGELKRDEKGGMFELRDEKSGDIKAHVAAQMINEYAAEMELWHSEHGKKTNDAKLAVKVDEDNLLKANLFVRPEIEADLTKTAKEATSEVKNIGQSEVMKETIVPMFESHKQIAADVLGTLNKMFKAWATEQKAFASQLGPEYEKLVDDLEQQFEMVQEGILFAYDTVKQKVEEFISSIPRSGFADRLRQLRSRSGDFAKEITAMLQKLSKLFNSLSRQMDEIQKQIVHAMKYLDEKLNLKELRAALKRFKEHLSSVDIIQTALREARKLSRKYNFNEIDQALGDVERDRKMYESKIVELYEKIKDFALNSVAVSALTRLSHAVLDPITPAPIDDVVLRNKWSGVMNFARGKITSEELAVNLWKKYIPIIKRKGPGRYDVEVTLPHGAPSLQEAVEDLHPDRLAALKSAVVDFFNSSAQERLKHALLDTIHTYKPVTGGIEDLIPPFESVGYIVGSDHFITFDGRAFAFRAGCEYLLAADFINQQFTIIASFVNKGGKNVLDSIKVEVRGDEIVLHRNGKVEVGHSSISLPWQKIDTMDGTALISAKKDGYWTVLNTYDGVRVQCNPVHDICEIALPGRMHGRSNGLLGANDNEPSNDHNLVDGTDNDEATNILAQHWMVKGSCMTNEAEPLRDHENQECSDLFEASSSPLRLCFSQVFSKPFKKMCAASGAKDKCLAASAYARACSHAGIDLDLPAECEHCPDGLIKGEEKRMENPPAEHDVVFVVEERECLDAYRNRIARVAQQIAQKQRSARFGWVGFGGEGVHHEPSVHYEGENALFDAQTIGKITQGKFESVSGIETKPFCPVQATVYAAKNFPFRLGSSKSIVLVTCRGCVASHAAQSEILDALLDQDITMNVMSLAKIRTSDGTKAVGMNAERLFSESGATVGIRSLLLSPKDVCSVVAQETRGSVFNIKHGSSIAASKIEPKTGSRCVTCHCVSDRLSSRSICSPCEVVEPVSLSSDSFTGIAEPNRDSLMDAFF